jgi:branched-chain amino acid transport system substrate-binding protein
MKRFTIVALISLFCALFAVSCTSKESGAAGTGPIKIGVILPMTGRKATFGEECWNGLQIALDELNPNLERKIDLIRIDDRGDATESGKSAMQLITVNKVVAIIGSVCSTETLAAAKIANDYKIPIITPSSTADKLTIGKEYLSRVCFIDSFQGGTMAEFAIKELGLKKAAITYDKTSDYSVGLASSFRETFQKLGGTVVAQENFCADDADFSPLISRVAAAAPQCIFIPAYYPDVGPMLKQAKGTWDKFVFLGGDGWDSPDFFKLAAQTRGGNYATSHFAPDDKDETVQNFVKKYRERYNKMPGAMAALGYDSGYLIYEALKLAPNATPEEIKNAINTKLDFQGVTGRIKMNLDRNAEKEIVILEVTPTGSKFRAKIPYKKY